MAKYSHIQTIFIHSPSDKDEKTARKTSVSSHKSPSFGYRGNSLSTSKSVSKPPARKPSLIQSRQTNPTNPSRTSITSTPIQASSTSTSYQSSNPTSDLSDQLADISSEICDIISSASTNCILSLPNIDGAKLTSLITKRLWYWSWCSY